MRLAVEARFHALNLAWRLGMPEAEVEAVSAEGKALAARSGDPGLLALMVGMHAAVRGAAGTTAEYLEASREALRLARQAGDPRVISFARTLVCLSSTYAGRFAEALALIDEELHELTAHPYPGPALVLDSDPVVVVTWMRGRILNYFGRLDEAARDLARAEAMARERRDQTALCLTLVFQGSNQSLRGDGDEALRLAHAAAELAERIADPFTRSTAHYVLGMFHLGSGRWQEARAAYETALAIMHTSRTNLSAEPYLRTSLGYAYAGLGDFEQARHLARAGTDVLLARGTLMMAVPALLNLARVLRLADGAAAASEIAGTLERAVAFIDETGMEAYRPFAHVERAELARLLGDEAACQCEMREALRLFVAMGATGHAQGISSQLSALSTQPEDQ